MMVLMSRDTVIMYRKWYYVAPFHSKCVYRRKTMEVLTGKCTDISENRQLEIDFKIDTSIKRYNEMNTNYRNTNEEYYFLEFEIKC